RDVPVPGVGPRQDRTAGELRTRAGFPVGPAVARRGHGEAGYGERGREGQDRYQAKAHGPMLRTSGSRQSAGQRPENAFETSSATRARSSLATIFDCLVGT